MARSHDLTLKVNVESFEAAWRHTRLRVLLEVAGAAAVGALAATAALLWVWGL
jgi:hypothetical protein